LEKAIPPLDDHSLSPPLSVVYRYSLKLIISYFDAPFKLEAVAYMSEEWMPGDDGLEAICLEMTSTLVSEHWLRRQSSILSTW